MNPYENLYQALEKQALRNSTVMSALEKTIKRENIAKKGLTRVNNSLAKYPEFKSKSSGLEGAVANAGMGIFDIIFHSALKTRKSKKWDIQNKYTKELSNLNRKKATFKNALTKNLGFSTHR